MSKVLELREKRARAWDAAKAFLDAQRGESGLLTAEDTATYEKMEVEVVALGKEIERLERQASIDAELSKPTSEPIVNKPATDKDAQSEKPFATNEYRDSFWRNLRGSTAPEILNALKIGEDTKGGYLVPDEFERQLIQALEEENIMRRMGKVIQTASGDRKIPVVVAKGSAAWVEEEGQIPESDDTFGQKSLGAHKVATMVKVSEELLNDSVFDLPSYIATEFGRRIGAKEEEAFIAGDGVGKPTGLLHTTEGAEIGVASGAESHITLDDMIDLFYSLRIPYRRRASFLLHDSTVKAIRKLKDSTGQYLWQPSIREGTPDTILGRPMYTSQYMPELAAGVKSVAFGDFSYYWIADRQSRVFKRLVELYATTAQVGFLAWQRVDGRLILREAVKVLQNKAAATPPPAPAK